MICFKLVIKSFINAILRCVKFWVDDILLEYTHQNGESDPSLSGNKRYTMNMEKMKNGNLQDSAEVVRDLLAAIKREL